MFLLKDSVHSRLRRTLNQLSKNSDSAKKSEQLRRLNLLRLHEYILKKATRTREVIYYKFKSHAISLTKDEALTS
jgi:hypothetical protein